MDNSVYGSFLVLVISILFHSKFLIADDSFASGFDPQPLSIFNRSSFPKGFIFGSAMASYQVEGAAFEYGKGPSIWDNFTHKYPERIADGSNGDIAIDFYHQYEEDIMMMNDLNMDAFRFSISWPRLLPRGKLSGGVNKMGIEFYNRVINYTISKGLEPFVTLFHWDVPQALQDEYDGFLSSRIVDDFRDFVELCFKNFGDRVKHWITLNEPLMFTIRGQDFGDHAPGRCSKWVNKACQAGDSSIEPYLVAHNLILAHGAAARLYKYKYQKNQNGKIGITLVSMWFEPHYANLKPDIEAAGRALDFMLGWFLDPITYGDYPFSMREIVGERLPNFTRKDSIIIKGSYDFLGVNYYTGMYAKNIPFTESVNVSWYTDQRVNLTVDRDGVVIGPPAGSKWLRVYPKGFRSLLNYVKNYYKNPTIYITENGVDEVNNKTLSLQEALQDPQRIDYHLRHLEALYEAIKDGVNVKGYFAWSLLDNFEWSEGYTVRFGITFVDKYLHRYSKLSATWFKNFFKRN